MGQVHVREAITDPVGAPQFVGQHWVNTATGAQWLSTGTSVVGDWKAAEAGNHPLTDIIGVPAPTVGTAGVIYFPRVNSAGDGYEFYRHFEQSDERTDGLINNTTTFETFLSVTYDIPVTGDYIFDFHYIYSINNTTLNFQAHIVDPSGAFRGPLHIETKDAGGTGVVFPTITGGVEGPTANTGTDQLLHAGGRFVNTLTAGNQTFLLEWNSTSADLQAAIHDATFHIRRIPT